MPGGAVGFAVMEEGQDSRQSCELEDPHVFDPSAKGYAGTICTLVVSVVPSLVTTVSSRMDLSVV